MGMGRLVGRSFWGFVCSESSEQKFDLMRIGAGVWSI